MFGVMAMLAGVDASMLPSDDKAEWERMEGKHPGWFPNRNIRDKVPPHPTWPLTHMRVDDSQAVKAVAAGDERGEEETSFGLYSFVNVVGDE